MEALYLLIPLSIAIAFVAIWFFFRMADSGQFDDMESPAWRILCDDDKPTIDRTVCTRTYLDGEINDG